MSGILVEGEPVLVEGEPYMLDARSDPPGFCIIRDVRGKSHLVRESKIKIQSSPLPAKPSTKKKRAS